MVSSITHTYNEVDAFIRSTQAMFESQSGRIRKSFVAVSITFWISSKSTKYFMVGYMKSQRKFLLYQSIFYLQGADFDQEPKTNSLKNYCSYTLLKQFITSRLAVSCFSIYFYNGTEKERRKSSCRWNSWRGGSLNTTSELSKILQVILLFVLSASNVLF